MRQINDTDHANTGLGERVKPAPAPTPQPKPTGTPGVFKRDDGKLETNIAPPPLPWMYAPPAAPVVVEDSGDEE